MQKRMDKYQLLTISLQELKMCLECLINGKNRQKKLINPFPALKVNIRIFCLKNL